MAGVMTSGHFPPAKESFSDSFPTGRLNVMLIGELPAYISCPLGVADTTFNVCGAACTDTALNAIKKANNQLNLFFTPKLLFHQNIYLLLYLFLLFIAIYTNAPKKGSN